MFQWFACIQIPAISPIFGRKCLILYPEQFDIGRGREMFISKSETVFFQQKIIATSKEGKSVINDVFFSG